jgi:L-ascorbate metabolism protein UlaG (beta-lactamase superfamily)
LSDGVTTTAAASDRTARASAVVVGGPTVLIRIAGARLLVDPTFSPPGRYESGPGRILTKLAGPALSADEVGPVDVVLLSHDQHVDNLDPAGRAVLGRAGLVLTTPEAADRLGGTARGLVPWQHMDLTLDSTPIRITAVPARHGPAGSEPITGSVTGFVLEAADAPTVYVSGDNASLDHVRDIADRFTGIDVAVLFAGGARSPKLLGAEYLTFDSATAAEAARVLRAPVVIPVHCEGWGHFTEGLADMRDAFTEAGMADRLVMTPPGRPTLF